ncbi:MAG: acyl--CoA ligase, partial [Clostridia bacterium]|nr:acyl--CoA ligase [Clostridia bacterium]
MPITDFLERNAKIYPNDTALVEINPEKQPNSQMTWREFNLIDTSAEGEKYRREISWREFDIKANRFANLLFTRGIKKGDKVAILLMNCLEWLPIYFGILKTGALVVPMNYRYSSDEIKYCLDLADVRMLVFGPEFIGRINAIADDIVDAVDDFFFVGNAADTPAYAD